MLMLAIVLSSSVIFLLLVSNNLALSPFKVYHKIQNARYMLCSTTIATTQQQGTT